MSSIQDKLNHLEINGEFEFWKDISEEVNKGNLSAQNAIFALEKALIIGIKENTDSANKSREKGESDKIRYFANLASKMEITLQDILDPSVKVVTYDGFSIEKN